MSDTTEIMGLAGLTWEQGATVDAGTLHVGSITIGTDGSTTLVAGSLPADGIGALVNDGAGNLDWVNSISQFTNDSNYQTDTQVNDAISGATADFQTGAQVDTTVAAAFSGGFTGDIVIGEVTLSVAAGLITGSS